MTVSNCCSMKSSKENGGGESVDRWSRGASVRGSDIRIRNWKLAGWFTLLVNALLLLHTSLELVFTNQNHIYVALAAEDETVPNIPAPAKKPLTKRLYVFSQKPTVTTASVNAGDHELYVGGSGCNGAFLKVLEQAGQDASKYQALHKAAVELRKQKSTNSDVITIMRDHQIAPYSDDVAFLAYKPLFEPPLGDTRPTTGSVFISIFKPTKRPFGQAKNVAMIYAVGPSGANSTVHGFFSDVERTAANIMDAVCQVKIVLQGEKDANGNRVYPPIERIRMPLISGGLYKHEYVSPATLALLILGGLEKRQRDISPAVQFINDDGNFSKVLALRNSTLSIVGHKNRPT